MVFEQLVQTMIGMDFFHLFFPWLLVLAVTYGVLDKFDYFDEDSVNGVVALAVSFIAIGGMYIFVPASMFPHFAAAISFTILGFVGLLVLMALAGYDLEEMDGDNLPGKAAMVIVAVAFVGVLSIQLGMFEPFISYMDGAITNAGDDELVIQVATMIFIVALVGVVTFAGSSDE